MMMIMMNDVDDDYDDDDDDDLKSSLWKRQKDILPPHLGYWQWSICFPGRFNTEYNLIFRYFSSIYMYVFIYICI